MKGYHPGVDIAKNLARETEFSQNRLHTAAQTLILTVRAWISNYSKICNIKVYFFVYFLLFFMHGR